MAERLTEARIAQILEVLASVAARDFGARADVVGDGSGVDAIAAAINMLTEELEAGLAEAERQAARARATSALLRSVLDNLQDGVVAVSADGAVQVDNPALRDLLDGADLPDALRDALEAASRTGTSTRSDLALPGHRTATIAAAPIPDLVGPSGAVALVRDVTAEREIDRTKTNLIAVVSHELRTPLTSVLGFTRMIQSRLESRILPHTDVSEPRTARAVAEVRDNLGIILAEGRRLSALINDVLDIAKMESGQMTYDVAEVAVGDLVQRATTASAALFDERPVHLVSEVDEGLPPLSGDFDRLLQVLINLLSNAAKFTEEGEVRLRASRGEQWVRIEVIDSGLGIPAEECERIFERFHQVEAHVGRPRGTGLGLPICRHIVEAHGGTITASSTLGVGTTLTVRLPAA